jgi:Fic family protein
MNNEKIPGLIKIALIHYFIGYIHPFYDGNGRINRFISSSLLRKQLGKIPATYLSYAIKNKISDYHDAFDICNDKNNCGDLTPFIILFLEFVYGAVSSAYNNCAEYSNKLTYYGDILSNSDKLNDEEIKVSFLLVQFKLFSPEQSFNESDIINISKLTRYSIKNITNSLLNKGFPIAVSRNGREIIYSIDLDALESWS